MAARRSRQDQLGQVIASRRFRIGRSDRRFAELRIGLPVADGRDAFCPVQLVGVGAEKVQRVYGVDSVQALQLATRLLEVMLLRYGSRITWHDEPAHESLTLGALSQANRPGAGPIQKRQSRRTSG